MPQKIITALSGKERAAFERKCASNEELQNLYYELNINSTLTPAQQDKVRDIVLTIAAELGLLEKVIA